MEEFSTNKKLVDTTMLIKLYSPVFTRRNVTKAIKSQRLPYMQVGRKRYFDIDNVAKMD